MKYFFTKNFDDKTKLRETDMDKISLSKRERVKIDMISKVSILSLNRALLTNLLEYRFRTAVIPNFNYKNLLLVHFAMIETKTEKRFQFVLSITCIIKPISDIKNTGFQHPAYT